MRDGNESAESEAITSESGFSLPMRDGNQTLCCQMGLVIRFQPTYEGWKFKDVVRYVPHRVFQPTYEGWKYFNIKLYAQNGTFQPTYEGWKYQFNDGVFERDTCFSLPMRDGNTGCRSKITPTISFQPTYEGWKCIHPGAFGDGLEVLAYL